MRRQTRGHSTPVCSCCGCVVGILSSVAGAPYQAVQMVTGWGDEAGSSSSAVRDFGAVDEANIAHCPEMEDVHLCIDGFCESDTQALFAVFDGCGGAECARFAAESLHETLAEELITLDSEAEGSTGGGGGGGGRGAAAGGRGQLPPPQQGQGCVDGEAVKEAMARSFATTDSVLERNGLGAMPESGTTALVCLLRREAGRPVLYTANAGDCRAVLSQSGEAFQLSQDHRASDASEAARVEASGGVIFDNCVMGVLPISRSLGHAPLKALIVGAPSFSRTLLDLSTDDALVLATDGVWDHIDNDEAIQLVRSVLQTRGGTAQDAAARLADECVSRGSKDNISVVVVAF